MTRRPSLRSNAPSTAGAGHGTREPERARVPKWLRILLPAVLILVWLTAAGVGGPYFGKVSEVSSNDQTSYLPESADATQVQALLGEFNDSDAIPAIVVFVGEEELARALGALLPRLAAESIILVERASKAPEPAWPAGITLDRRKDYGDTTLWWASAD